MASSTSSSSQSFSVFSLQDTRTARAWHGALALLLVLPLTITFTSGMLYRVCRRVLDMSSSQVGWLMQLHTLDVAGLNYIYPVIIGVLCSALIIVGAPLTLTIVRAQGWKILKPSTLNFRMVHRAVSLLISFPLLLTSVTGVMFTIATKWIGVDRKSVKWMLQLHQMSMFMNPAIYVTFLGLGSLFLVFSGVTMLGPHVETVLENYNNRSRGDFAPVPSSDSEAGSSLSSLNATSKQGNSATSPSAATAVGRGMTSP